MKSPRLERNARLTRVGMARFLPQFALIDKLFTAPRPPPLVLLPGTREVDASTVTSVESEVVFESASLAAKVVCDEHKAHLSSLWRCMRTLATGEPALDEEGVSSVCDPHEILALATLLLSLSSDTFSTRVHAAIQATHSNVLCLVQQHSGTISRPRVALNDGESLKDSRTYASPGRNFALPRCYSASTVADVWVTRRIHLGKHKIKSPFLFPWSLFYFYRQGSWVYHNLVQDKNEDCGMWK